MDFKKIKELQRKNVVGEFLDTCKMKVELPFYRHLVVVALLVE